MAELHVLKHLCGVRGGKQPPVIEAALKEQQRSDLERSLEYAKKVLGVGVRWKS